MVERFPNLLPELQHGVTFDKVAGLALLIAAAIALVAYFRDK